METTQKFFIRIKDGQPQGYPFLLDNLLQCNIDPQQNPDWAEFLPQPVIQTLYKNKVVEQHYVVDGSRVLGTWVERKMTPEELSQLPPDPLLTMKGSEPDALD